MTDSDAELVPRLPPNVTPAQVQIGDMAVELLKRGEIMHFFPTGHSMSPMIRENEEVLTQGVKPEDLRTGEVVVMYQNNGRIVIHRLTRLLRSGAKVRLWTKGDGGLRWDLPAPSSACVGRAILVRKPKQDLDLLSPYWRLAGFLAAQISLLQTLLIRIPGFGAYTPKEERTTPQRFWLHAAKLPFRGFIHVCMIVDRIRARFSSNASRPERS